MPGKYPNDLNDNEHGSTVKVIQRDGKVRYEEATYWGQAGMKKFVTGKARKKR